MPTPIPLACTLSPGEFRDRAQWLRELADSALLAHRVDGLEAQLFYRLEAADEVENMVAQERRCCGFLRFELTRSADRLALRITAPEEAGDDARALFAHLAPD